MLKSLGLGNGVFAVVLALTVAEFITSQGADTATAVHSPTIGHQPIFTHIAAAGLTGSAGAGDTIAGAVLGQTDFFTSTVIRKTLKRSTIVSATPRRFLFNKIRNTEMRVGLPLAYLPSSVQTR